MRSCTLSRWLNYTQSGSSLTSGPPNQEATRPTQSKRAGVRYALMRAPIENYLYCSYALLSPICQNKNSSPPSNGRRELHGNVTLTGHPLHVEVASAKPSVLPGPSILSSVAVMRIRPAGESGPPPQGTYDITSDHLDNDKVTGRRTGVRIVARCSSRNVRGVHKFYCLSFWIRRNCRQPRWLLILSEQQPHRWRWWPRSDKKGDAAILYGVVAL